jgi:hypothetical protein
MSTGNLRYEIKGEDQLAEVLGKADTPHLYARGYRVDTLHDIPYTAGNSVDGATVYVDKTAYREAMDGVIYVRGMTPTQIINAWEEHEHSEWAMEMGDNPVQTYPGAHGLATASEHRFVRKLPIDPDRYEECILAGLKRAKRRFISTGTSCNPPRDLWCGPVLDDPDPEDKEIIRILKAKGVEDAFKLAKNEVDYGVGADRCKQCAMYGDRDILPSLRKCELVNGLVRDNNWCDRWTPRNTKGNGHVR